MARSEQEDAFHIRLATVADAVVIAQHRAAMFKELNRVASDGALTQLCEASSQAIFTALRTGDYVGWLAIAGTAASSDAVEVVVGGVGLHLRPTFPRPSADGMRVESASTPHVVNVYTVPAWRRRGVAHRLMQELLDWAQKAGVDRVTLNASAAGRPLYGHLGFEPAPGMLWRHRPS